MAATDTVSETLTDIRNETGLVRLGVMKYGAVLWTDIDRQIEGILGVEMKAKWIYAAATLLTVASGASLAEGDAGRGETLYAVCATCHGPQGEGMEAMNAPALAGREEWYLVRQLENFKSGVRGGDSADTFGMTMAPMAQTLPDKQAMEDVAADLAGL